MDKIPKRLGVANIYRQVLRWLENYLVLPKIDPGIYQIVALGLSVWYLFAFNNSLRFWIVAVVLISDWFDGAAARKMGMVSKKGWMIDVVVDRVSEGFIFAGELSNPLGKVFFFLYLVNTLLSMYSVKTGRHVILPLRFVWLLLLLTRF